MPRVKTAPSRQITIPKKFWDMLHLKPGDILEVELDEENNSLVYTPKEVVDKTETERKNWIKSLIKTGSKQETALGEDELVVDKKIKKQLFEEKYGKKR